MLTARRSTERESIRHIAPAIAISSKGNKMEYYVFS